MCYLQVYIVFDFADETTLQSPKNIGAAFEALFKGQQASHFQLAGEDYETVEAAWSSAVRQSKRSAYVALSDNQGYEITFSVVTNNWRRAYFTANRGQMTQKGPESLLEACMFFRNALAADYGFGFVAMDTDPLPPTGEGDYGLTTLYDYNFLSPRLIDKLGRDKLASLPVYKVRNFPDGGLLLEMARNPLVDKKNSAPAYQAAAMILGLPKFQQGC
jgi:hypothetical protein